MKSFFASLTRLSLRFRVLTVIIALVIGVFGVVAATQLQLELIPAIEFPQTVILSQVSGMSSEEALAVLTRRIEDALAEIPEVVNIETTTTGAIGSVTIARNEFGVDSDRMQERIRAALDGVWLPLRRLTPPEGEAPEAFGARLIGDLPADALLYLTRSDQNFLFQLSPEVWAALDTETVRVLVGYLAAQTEEASADGNALRGIVDQEIVPQLTALDAVASVQVSGGQILPEEGASAVETTAESGARSQAFRLSNEVWAVIAGKLGAGDRTPESVAALADPAIERPLGTAIIPLPESWHSDGFKDAGDLREMRGGGRTAAGVLNAFLTSGEIVGPIGQTDDLTPDTITQMLAIAPSMIEYLDARMLAAMTPEVFAAIPQTYLDGLDGFARDELAAAALARSITGDDATPVPVDLPSAWKIAPPRLITFSFDDLPLATFSVFGADLPQATEAPATVTDATGESGAEGETAAVDSTGDDAPALPEGPALPGLFGLIGGQLGVEFDTADDLIDIQLPPDFAALAGGGSLPAAQFFNFLLLLADPAALEQASGGAGGFSMQDFDLAAALPALAECGINPLALASGNADLASALIGCMSPEVIAYLAENDPTFLTTLQPAIYEAFSDEVLAQPLIAPPLPDVWDTLAGRPQFAQRPLASAADVLALGDGAASTVLNAINATVPAEFAGYEVRLFDSLTPALLRYWALQEPGFYAALDSAVIAKLSPEALAALPQDVTAALDADTAATVAAIASGEEPSAAQALASLYTVNLPPADPDAPALNTEWGFIGNFYGIELDSADDFFRFPDGFPFPLPSDFINSIFDSAQGANFAVQMFGNTPQAVWQYLLDRDASVYDALRIEALQLIPEAALAILPDAVQQRAAEGGTPFIPTAAVTRNNGASSLLVSVYKTAGTNTVSAYHEVEAVLEMLAEQDENLRINVVFEQASFIEESISGVAREGILGGIFAILMILVFMSSGVWAARPRRITGLVLIIGGALLLVALTAANLGAAGGDWSLAFGQVNIIFSVPLVIAIVAGLMFVLWPQRVPYPAWRSTLVTAVSIPLSVLIALALMRWLPPTVNGLLAPSIDNPLVAFFARLFPASITLNIMTLSGLTVAIGRVVDDSIVVLENIFRQIQEGGDKREAIIKGTRDVSIAIFAATVITVVVFLPLGLTGGLIGEFFLPFGLAVTYSLLASFVVAITVIPVLVYWFVRADEIHEEEHGALERVYLPALRWSLGKPSARWTVLAVAAVTFVIGIVLFASRPAAFLPDFGEPQISADVNLPAGTKITETNALVTEFEAAVTGVIPAEDLKNLQVIIGSGGLSLETILGTGGGVNEAQAQITIGIHNQDALDRYAQLVRTEAERVFGVGNATVSAASLSAQGFGAFALVLSGPPQDLEAIDARVIETLGSVPGLTNISSTLEQIRAAGAADGTYLRVDREDAVSYTGELESQDSLNVISAAKAAVLAMPDLPDTITVSEGFESRLQTEGFASLFVAMGIAIVIVILILIVTFGSLVHWLAIMLSVVVAPVGAAVALTLTERVLGISALIGLLMLIGIVVTNAVVLIDRVQANRRERGMATRDALVEAGGRRLRPILMTAFATIFALLPLAVGLSEGAIIASELGTVVIGGLFSSTLLTLLVVPVAYMLIDPLHLRVSRLLGRKSSQ